MDAYARVLVGATLAAVFSWCSAEVIGERTQTFLVKFNDGTAERYVAKYTGHLNVNRTESGRASKMDHPVDTRKCHWTIGTHIQREICLVSRAGDQFCKGQLNRIYGTSFANRGSDFKVKLLHPENCGNARDRYDSDVNNARNAVAAALRTVVDEDRHVVKRDMQNTLKAADVVAQ